MAELTRRYVVMTMATEAPFDLADPDGAFVLKPWKDPAALEALRAYAAQCYPALADDLQTWIVAIERGPVVRGDVGRRNEDHQRRTAKSRKAPARPRAAKTRARVATKSRRPGRTKRRRS